MIEFLKNVFVLDPWVETIKQKQKNLSGIFMVMSVAHRQTNIGNFDQSFLTRLINKNKWLSGLVNNISSVF